MSFRYELILAALLAVVAFVIGAASGAYGWAFFGASVAWISVNIHHYQKIKKWSQQPLTRPENAPESWYELAIGPFRTVQRQRQRTRQFIGRIREVTALMEAIPDAVVVLNESGEIEDFNTAAERLLSLQETDKGLSLVSVVRSSELALFLKQADDEKILEFNSPLDPERSLEGRTFQVEYGRTVVIVRDNTELNRLLTMRQSFVANVSHELRTPLTVVSGYLETIEDETQEDDLRLHLVSKIGPPISRIKSLVGDLLLLTRLESTPSESDFVPLPMRQIIQNAIAEAQGLAQSPEQIQFEAKTDMQVMGIEVEIYGVCVNLLSNALRYSPEKTPVEVTWEELDDICRLTVKDHGVGIAPEHLSRITERFYRVDMADSRTRGGTGLGLAIVKHALLRHNSELKVESEVGVGSTFYCEFASISADE